MYANMDSIIHLSIVLDWGPCSAMRATPKWKYMGVLNIHDHKLKVIAMCQTTLEIKSMRWRREPYCNHPCFHTYSACVIKPHLVLQPCWKWQHCCKLSWVCQPCSTMTVIQYPLILHVGHALLLALPPTPCHPHAIPTQTATNFNNESW